MLNPVNENEMNQEKDGQKGAFSGRQVKNGLIQYHKKQEKEKEAILTIRETNVLRIVDPLRGKPGWKAYQN